MEAVKDDKNNTDKSKEDEEQDEYIVERIKSPISNKNNESQEKDVVEKDQLACHLCMYNCNTNKKLTRHMKEEHRIEGGICPLCHKDCQTLSLLCDNFSEIHMEKNYPNCNDEHMNIFLSLYRAQLHESDDSGSDGE